MPLLKKEILSAGKYLVSGKDSNGENVRVKKEFNEPELQKIAATANNMIGSGLLIPAPFGHNPKAIPNGLKEILDRPPQSSYNNAGYWLSVVQEKNEEGKPALFAYIDLPGSDEDTNSLYWKAKNSAKEVSISLMDKYVDGLGRTWENALMHAAFVNHPVMPAQSEFKDVPEGSFTVSMSMLDPDDSVNSPSDGTGLIGQLRTALAAKGIILPSDSSSKTILRDLLVAVSQLGQGSSAAAELTPAPIYMSTNFSSGDDMKFTKQQAESIIATKAVNPATNLPYTLKDFGIEEVSPQQTNLSAVALQAELAEKDKKIENVTAIAKALLSQLQSKVKEDFTKRINALIARGYNKDAAAATLTPLVDSFQMSVLSDGSLSKSPLEVTLSALEAAMPAQPSAPPQVGGVPVGAFPIPNPFEQSSSDLPEADLNKTLDEIVKML